MSPSSRSFRWRGSLSPSYHISSNNSWMMARAHRGAHPRHPRRPCQFARSWFVGRNGSITMICHLDDGASLAQRPHRGPHWPTQHRLGVVRRQRAFHLHVGIAVLVDSTMDFNGSKRDEEYVGNFRPGCRAATARPSAIGIVVLVRSIVYIEPCRKTAKLHFRLCGASAPSIRSFAGSNSQLHFRPHLRTQN